MAYDTNDVVRFSLRVTDPYSNDDAVDPSTVVFKLKNPSASTTTYTYGVASELVKSATGSYYIDLSLATAGTWYWRWQTTGTYAGAEEGAVTVEVSQF